MKQGDVDESKLKVYRPKGEDPYIEEIREKVRMFKESREMKREGWRRRFEAQMLADRKAPVHGFCAGLIFSGVVAVLCLLLQQCLGGAA